MLKSEQSFSFTVAHEYAGQRLDIYLAHLMREYTRSFLGKLIHDGKVRVDGKQLKAGYRVRKGERITVTVPPPPPSELIPEEVDFRVLYEDEDLLVLVKPPGLVVHPAAGHRSGTLAHGLLFHCDTLPGAEDHRPGIVHRLDKDTSGIMLVAKSEKALRKLTDDFRERNIRKTYHAVLLRCPLHDEGRITEPIGRHPVSRKKMSVRTTHGRFAATRYKVLERFESGLCFAELDIETGRTHQIRVHMAFIGCPIAGDALYGGRIPDTFGIRVERQLLHASTIAFDHPVTGEHMVFSAPLWSDMEMVLDSLRGKMVPL